MCETRPLEWCLLSWAKEERRIPGSSDSYCGSEDPVERWLYGFLGYMTDFFFSPENFQRLNPDTTDIANLTQKDRECIRDHVKEMTELWDRITQGNKLPECPVCHWHHDEQLTNMWSGDIGPFVFPYFKTQNAILRAIHDAMEKGQTSLAVELIDALKGQPLNEAFRYTNSVTYRYLIETRNGMVRIKRPGEYCPSLSLDKDHHGDP